MGTAMSGADDEFAPAAMLSTGSAPPPLGLLLQRLAVDGGADGGGALYEQLRRRLVVYFRLHLPAEAESLADQTFDRMARKLHEGVQIREVRLFAAGVARMICLEALARERRRLEAMREPPPVAENEAPDEYPDEDEQQRKLALAACLRQLGLRSSELILNYYAGDGAQTRQARRRLAAELGVSLNSLRNRALRIRETLEQCIWNRLRAPQQP